MRLMKSAQYAKDKEMNKRSLKNVSKYISFVLRHNPYDISDKIGKDRDYEVMDSEGYVFVADLLEACNINLDELKEIVDTDEKKRYSFHPKALKIRANQGHSTKKANLTLKEETPPTWLYHGTSSKFLENIMKGGLRPMTRQYVHLTDDLETASKVGKRHGGELKILKISTIEMLNDGLKFFKSENDVWLALAVPSKYLR